MLGRISSKSGMRWAYDLVLAGLVAYSTLSEGTGADWLIGLSMAVAVVFRRRLPLTVMAVVSALALTQYLLAALPREPLAGEITGYDGALLVAMVTVVSHTEQMWKVYAAGGVVVLGVAVAYWGESSGTSASSQDSLNEGLMVAGFCVGVWLTAYVLRTRRLYVAVLEERAVTAERERAQLARLAAAEERAAIARELHDVVAHSLSVMTVQADGASYAIETDRGRAQEALRTIAATGRDALEDMHHIVKVLRGGKEPGGEGDEDRRRVGLDHLEPLVERARAAGLHVDLSIGDKPAGLSNAGELTLFRIVQEGMTNALRHAGPGAHVAVTLTFDEDTAALEVVDDGAGQRVGSGSEMVPASGGNGLVGMREQVDVYGGRFSAGPRLGPGWQVRVELPVRTAA
ncbi:histidine kinase [Streptomyces sp. NBC_01775]|uniref:sensor histidine kinase n=1 Tax=Streptomyces sp. NBC_01775 TaxID=2975939 RepID=UPI002DDA8E51|nr:histidine kinase [Streptomyces sp. NBC_01775]WSB77068.1 histidine kinase [Streptomyces sp. NBC_01775]